MKGKRKKEEWAGNLWDEGFSGHKVQKSRKRAAILISFIGFCFFAISIRLFDLMLLQHEALANRANRQYLRTKTLKPQRGVIWDRNLRELAINVEVDSLYAVPSEVSSIEALSSGLAPVINVSYNKLVSAISAKKDKDFIWVMRKMDEETSHNVTALKEREKFKGIDFVTETKRFYPKGQTAAHILGFTNIDNKGISGLELQYDEYMRGTEKKVFMGKDARGKSLAPGIEDELAGSSMILTIDEGLQYIVERELSQAMSDWEAAAAVAIMIRPSTGEILAMANMPTYDPNLPGESVNDNKRNRAITDMYEPGSTLKAVLSSVAYEEGVVSLNQMFDVSRGFIVVGGKPIKDVHRNGVLSFQDVIKKSSNVGAVQIGMKLGKERYYSYLKKFGFGDRTGIDMPGEVSGILRSPARWSGTSIGAISIGQEIGVTPLQLVRAYSAIANGGLLMKPYVVSEIISDTGESIKRNTPVAAERVMSARTAKVITDILKGVTETGGTGKNAEVAGNLVAGKTGTAQKIDPNTGLYSKNKFISSFVGFAPADDPELALIVVVYEPKGATYGGVVAAPVFRRIVENAFAYLNIPMEKNENHIMLVDNSR
ncbi:MAG: penicillin-binding protein 2 [Nitrospirae bacterium]|nr:penicillin-binding protein 2 [Nitrospirota bacterium]